MSLHKSLADYLSAIKHSKFTAVLGNKGGYITFSNTGKGGDIKSFTISLSAFLTSFNDINNNISKFISHKNYVESDWRSLSSDFSDNTIKSIITVQTKPTFTTMSKLVGWANDRAPSAYEDGVIEITQEIIANTIDKLTKLVDCYVPKEAKVKPSLDISDISILPKPFLLLAGISGTGKTRFVREQAAVHNKSNSNYCLIPVRPDWHDIVDPEIRTMV